MDAYVSLAIIIVILLVGLIVFVVYKESGWKLVKEDEDKGRGHGHDERWRREREERWRREREERERRERWRREHDRH